MNEEFSFVRFLKVVKTLYETSTFTQLGKTVGSALAPTPPPKRTRAKKVDAEEDISAEVASPNSISIFDVIDKACIMTQSKNSSPKPNRTVSKRQTAPSQSLMDQVMGCSLVTNAEDEDSDGDDTFNTRTYDDQSFDTEGMSYSMASVTDDEEVKKQSRRRRS
jgi:hypothetical protein